MGVVSNEPEVDTFTVPVISYSFSLCEGHQLGRDDGILTVPAALEEGDSCPCSRVSMSLLLLRERDLSSEARDAGCQCSALVTTPNPISK